MALQGNDGWVSHEAQFSVDKLSKEIIDRGEPEIVERRETEARVEQLAERHGTDNAQSPRALQDRRNRRQTRAHTTVMGTTEPVPGAPRSGSA